MSTGPDDYGFVWHFGRWMMDGVKVEMAHIAPPGGMPMSADGAGIWEAGPEIWPHIRRVPFGGHRVPVAPLEIQLGTCISRGLEDRVAAIIAVFQEGGYDRKLLETALNRGHMEAFESLMEGTVG